MCLGAGSCCKAAYKIAFQGTEMGIHSLHCMRSQVLSRISGIHGPIVILFLAIWDPASQKFL